MNHANPRLGCSLLLFSFHLVTCVTKKFFITQPQLIGCEYIPQFRKQPLEEGCSKQVLWQGKCFLGKVLDNACQQLHLFLWPPQGYVYKDGCRQCIWVLSWFASSQFWLESAGLHVQELSFHKRAFMGTQTQTGSAHALLYLFTLISPK